MSLLLSHVNLLSVPWTGQMLFCNSVGVSSFFRIFWMVVFAELVPIFNSSLGFSFQVLATLDRILSTVKTYACAIGSLWSLSILGFLMELTLYEIKMHMRYWCLRGFY